MQSDGSISDVLRSVEVPVIPDFDCDAAYGGDGVYIAVFPSMVCAGDTVTSKFPPALQIRQKLQH